jgi:hypothetical protein
MSQFGSGLRRDKQPHAKGRRVRKCSPLERDKKTILPSSMIQEGSRRVGLGRGEYEYLRGRSGLKVCRGLWTTHENVGNKKIVHKRAHPRPPPLRLHGQTRVSGDDCFSKDGCAVVGLSLAVLPPKESI